MPETFDATDVDIICEQVVEGATERWEEDSTPEDVLWDAVGEVVPQLTRPFCDAILEHSTFTPLTPIVVRTVLLVGMVGLGAVLSLGLCIAVGSTLRSLLESLR